MPRMVSLLSLEKVTVTSKSRTPWILATGIFLGNHADVRDDYGLGLLELQCEVSVEICDCCILGLPFSTTVAPITGSPVWSVTVPLAVVWAET